jgi:acetyltransferase-like isoleucine patch superfamily enzyme
MTYVPQADDLFVAAVGDTRFKRNVVAALRLRGAHFTGLYGHVVISPRAKCGKSIFGDRATISVDASVGDFVYVGADVILGHDVVVGDHAHIGARCFVAGKACIEEGATIHPMSSIAIGVRIGKGATVGLGSVVFHNVPDNVTVAGNPARQVSNGRQ